jgi:hypothetical protein
MGIAFILIAVFLVMYVITVNWRMLLLAFTHPSGLVRFLAILVVLFSMRGCAELWVWATA